ncbi:hypothetical protein PMZ80_010590, partial [Knufia obscura]
TAFNSSSSGTRQRPLIPKASMTPTGQADESMGIPVPNFNNLSIQARTINTIRRDNLGVALWLGLVCDAVDVASSIACAMEGNLSDMAKLSVGAGAALFAAISAQQLRSLKK